LPVDTDASGVPDFVEEVALRGDESLAAFATAGFRAPLGDDTLGGDDRVDIYLKNLAGADGHFEPDAGSCQTAPRRCAGSVTMENDFAGYPYPSTSIGIRVLTSHELFHAVQNAYDAEQPLAWMEGSAVWAEEYVYPEQDDFELLVAGFIAKMFRPFERPGGGFGDPYPYGAGLWPYFLVERHGVEGVRGIWERCGTAATPDFLAAAAAELAARGDTLEAAWIELARWIALTGDFATGEGFPEPERLGEPRRESPIIGSGAMIVGIEGMSARYVPLALTGTTRVEVRAGGAPVALDVVGHGEPIEVVRLAGDGGLAALQLVEVRGPATTITVTIVVTGATRGAAVEEVMLAVSPDLEPPDPMMPPPDPEPDDDGGCSSAPGAGLALALASIPLARFSRRARRRGTAPSA
jgi:hypothetical protein